MYLISGAPFHPLAVSLCILESAFHVSSSSACSTLCLLVFFCLSFALHPFKLRIPCVPRLLFKCNLYLACAIARSRSLPLSSLSRDSFLSVVHVCLDINRVNIWPRVPWSSCFCLIIPRCFWRRFFSDISRSIFVVTRKSLLFHILYFTNEMSIFPSKWSRWSLRRALLSRCIGNRGARKHEHHDVTNGSAKFLGASDDKSKQ